MSFNPSCLRCGSENFNVDETPSKAGKGKRIILKYSCYDCSYRWDEIEDDFS